MRVKLSGNNAWQQYTEYLRVQCNDQVSATLCVGC